MMDFAYQNGIYVPKADFLTLPRPPSIANLSQYLTANGVRVKADVRYNGKDAGSSSWAPWGPGGSLTITSGTSPTLNDGSPLFGGADDSVKFNTGAAYEDTTGLIGQVTTEDFVIEAIIKTQSDGAADGFIATTRNSSTGWLLYQPGYQIRLLINDGTSSVSWTGVKDPDHWYHVLVFVNRDEASTDGCKFYINGVVDGSGADMSSSSSSLSSENFTIGRRAEASTAPYQSNVAYLAMWKYASWFKSGSDGPAEWAEIAFERFCTLFSAQAYGGGTKTPLLFERSGTDYTMKWEESLNAYKLYQIGEDMPAFKRVKDKSGQIFWGYSPNEAAENKITEAEDLTTDWSSIALNSISSNVVDCPDGRTVVDGTIANTTDTQHGASITATLTAQLYTFYVLAKPGDQNWVKLEDSTLTNCYAYFRIDSGNEQVGSTPGAGVDDAYVFPNWWNGFTMVSITFTATAASHTLKILSAAADNDDDFVGDDSTINTYWWGMTCVQHDCWSTPIISVGGTKSRVWSALRYKGDDGFVNNVDRIGSMQNEFWFPDYNIRDPRPTMYITKNALTTDRIFAYAQSAENYRSQTEASGGNSGVCGAGTDVADGYPHRVLTRWEDDNLENFDNLDAGTPDTDCLMPGDQNHVNIANNQNASLMITGLIRNASIFENKIDLNSGKIVVAARKRGVDQLNPSLTINGTTKTPEIRFKGGDADGTDWNYWTYGGDLTITTATAPSYNQGFPDVGQTGKRWDLNTDSVKFNNGAAYEDTGGTIGQIGTEDFVIEIVFKFYQTDTDFLMCTRYDAEGYLVRIDSNKTLQMGIFDSGGQIFIDTPTSTFVENNWYHAMIFGNRDENSNDSSRWYVDGVEKGTGDNISSINGSLSGANFTIGRKSSPGTGNAAEANVVYCAMWKQASWHQAGASGPAEWALIAKARSDAFWGTV